jgi:plastocyanin
MTEPEETTEDARDGLVGELAGLGRRPLLKALGAGATLSLGGGIAAAADGRFRGQDEDGGDSEQIDPVFGYPTTNPEAIPEALDPDHEVQLLVAPPMGPTEPPFLYFDPTGLQIQSGDIVRFSVMSPDHSITAFHPGIGPRRRVPEGAEPFSSPILGPGAAWLYRFEQEGVYDVYCGPHFILGMVMRLVVGDLAEADVPEYAKTVEGLPTKEQFNQGLNRASEQNENCEWPFVLPAEVLGTDALDPMNIQDAGEVPFTAVAEDLEYEFVPPEEREAPADNETTEGNETADGNATAEDGETMDGDETTEGNETSDGNATDGGNETDGYDTFGFRGY